MTAVKSDLQKLENLLNSATNERQRKMYQALLDKARHEAKNMMPTPSSSPTKKSQAGKTDAVASTSQKKQSKFTPQKASPNNDNHALPLEVTSSQIKQDRAERKTALQEVAPTITSSQSQSNQHSHQTDKRIFQAVGLIKCTPYLENEKIKLTINNHSYDLRKLNGRLSKQFSQLARELEENGSRQMLLRVYPHIIHSADNSEIRHLFSLVRAYLDESKYPDAEESFVFRGIWQYVPYCSTPVISIHRNIDNLNFYQRLPFAAKKFFIRPQGIPVVWNAPVDPFVYHRSRSKSEQMPRYFVEVRATFKDGQYTVVEMLNEPTLDIPKFIKPPRKKPKS